MLLPCPCFLQLARFALHTLASITLIWQALHIRRKPEAGLASLALVIACSQSLFHTLQAINRVPLACERATGLVGSELIATVAALALPNGCALALRGTAATALSRPFHAGVWTALSIIVQEEARIACFTLVPCGAIMWGAALLAIGTRTCSTGEGTTRSIVQQSKSWVARLTLLIGGPCSLGPAHLATGPLARFAAEGSTLEAIRKTKARVALQTFIICSSRLLRATSLAQVTGARLASEWATLEVVSELKARFAS